jgi:hypothetical protein
MCTASVNGEFTLVVFIGGSLKQSDSKQLTWAVCL